MDNPGVILVSVIIIVGGSLAFYLTWRSKSSDDVTKWMLEQGRESKKYNQRKYGLKILKKRLEKGEITQEEYNELKKQFE
jgi:uncharacterized membrane protein